MWQEKESRREVAYGLVSRIEGIEIRVVSISEWEIQKLVEHTCILNINVKNYSLYTC